MSEKIFFVKFAVRSERGRISKTILLTYPTLTCNYSLVKSENGETVLGVCVVSSIILLLHLNEGIEIGPKCSISFARRTKV